LGIIPAVYNNRPKGLRVASILCIDDEPSILKMLKNALEAKQFDVTICNDSENALNILQQKSFDMITLDIRMPGKDGFSLYKEFRNFHHIPTLFVTGFPKSFNMQSDDIVSLWQEEFVDGTTDILYKPFELNDLYEKIEGLIGSSTEQGQ
jgi:DNA-binding response OmpR family regulator